MTKIKPDYNIDNPWYNSALVYEGIFTKDQQKTDKAYQQFRTGFSKNSQSYFIFVALELNQSTLSRPIHDQVSSDIIKWYHQLDIGSRNQIVWQNIIARLEGNLNALNTDNLEGFTKSAKIGRQYMAALTLIDAERNEEVPLYIERLKALTMKNYGVSSQWGSAYAYYALGVIYAQLGQINEAINNLTMAKQGGFPATISTYQYDKDLSPLFDLPAFQELNKPIWPDIKD